MSVKVLAQSLAARWRSCTLRDTCRKQTTTKAKLHRHQSGSERGHALQSETSDEHVASHLGAGWDLE